MKLHGGFSQLPTRCAHFLGTRSLGELPGGRRRGPYSLHPPAHPRRSSWCWQWLWRCLLVGGPSRASFPAAAQNTWASSIQRELQCRRLPSMAFLPSVAQTTNIGERLFEGVITHLSGFSKCFLS